MRAGESDDEKQRKKLLGKTVSEGADPSLLFKALANSPQRERTPEQQADLEKRWANLVDKLKKKTSAPYGI